MEGGTIGPYRVTGVIGQGGMGAVYAAEHALLGRPAAIKVLLPELSQKQDIVMRFFNEARAATAIRHPGIVEIYDFGTHTDGRAYIAMALLHGESLEHRLRRGPMAFDDGATIGAQAVAALAAAHARGIVHRDLKPDNLFLIPNDLLPSGIQVVLLDFGIAKLGDDQTAGLKTQTGALMGTPAYMSPEQCMGRADLDHRTDLYAIGCILFHVFCGRPPFVSAQGTGMMIAAHIRDPAPDPRTLQPQLPAALAMIVLRCLEKEPAARFQTASELRNALVAAGANAPPSKPPGAEQYAATLAGPGSPSAPGAPGWSSAPGAPSGAPRTGAPPVAVAATTRGGAAAQIATSPPTAAGRSRAGLVAGGVLLALIGAGAAVAVTRGRGDAPATERAGSATTPQAERAGSATPPQAERAGSAIAQAEQAGSATPPPPPPPGDRGGAAAGSATQAAEPPCPPGQTRRDDTHGRCCWPAQAWSISASKCVGAPRCPAGMVARRSQCVAAAEPSIATRRPGSGSAAATTTTIAVASAAPGVRIDASSYAPGDPIEVRFTAPVSSTPHSQAWITVVEANQPPAAYGAWSYLDDGATSATLKAPSKPGAYQVRLHTDYPTRTFNVQAAVDLTVGSHPAEAALAAEPTPLSHQRFTLATRALRPGAKIHVVFAVPLRAAPREQFWVTVVPAGAADSTWAAYEYVPAGARHLQLAAPTTAGDYEVRLHANYPTKTTNLVHRVAIRVED